MTQIVIVILFQKRIMGSHGPFSEWNKKKTKMGDKQSHSKKISNLLKF